MTDTKISALSAAAALTGLEQLAAVQSAATVRTTVADIRNQGDPVTFALQTGVQASPGAGKAKLFFRSKAGRALPEMQGGATGEKDTALQPALFGNLICELWPSSGTGVVGRGINWTSEGGTISTPTLATTDRRQAMRRITGTTGTTTATASGVRAGAALVWRGNATDLGGFFFFARFAIGLGGGLGHQAFVGLTALTTALAGEPSAIVNMIGVGFDSGDAVASGWQLMTNDASGTATKTAYAAAARNLTTVLDLTLWCAPFSDRITVRLYDQTAQAVVIDNVAVTADLPANTAFLVPRASYRNGATTTSGAIDVAQIYVESDH
jgi:hypothetical protein